MLPWATTEQDDRLLSDPHLLLLPLVTHGHVVPCFMFDQELTSADYPLRESLIILISRGKWVGRHD